MRRMNPSCREMERKDNEYSVNLPTRFYYKKKWNKGWINVVNPFIKRPGVRNLALYIFVTR